MENKKFDVTSDAPVDNCEWLDLDAARDALLIDKNTILELVQQFLQDRAHYVEPLKGCLAQQDWKNLVAYAHRLKGTATNLRIYGLAEPAVKLEKAAAEKHVGLCEEQLQIIEDRFTSLAGIVEQR
ncbi:MAG: Hpt domain-containing protein [Spirochaetia bacterium]|nr:Hpt domain-containing protein [Spirochaetia bacterium]